MPKAYAEIRDKFLKEGQSLKYAKTHAAKIYNSLRDKHPSMTKLSNKPDKKK